MITFKYDVGEGQKKVTLSFCREAGEWGFWVDAGPATGRLIAGPIHLRVAASHWFEDLFEKCDSAQEKAVDDVQEANARVERLLENMKQWE